MDMTGEGSRVSAALKQCQDIQHMIDITSQHLERLRSSFSDAGDELTMQEIRTLEGKLIKQFSEQLAVKYGLGSHAADLQYFPSLSQWLTVVGVSTETNDAIKSSVKSLEQLKDKTECELKRILITSSRVSPRQIPEDLRRLCRSLLNLRKYTDALMYGNKMYGPNQDVNKLELHWDSWDTSYTSSPKHEDNLHRSGHMREDNLHRSVPLRLSTGKSHGSDSAASSLSSSSSIPPPSPGPYIGHLVNTLSPPSLDKNNLITPPATPPWVILGKVATPTVSHLATPPAAKKLSTGVNNICKSESHDLSELSSKIVDTCEVGVHGSVPGHVSSESSHMSETIDSSGYSSSSEAPGPRMRLPSSDPESGHEMSCPVPSPIASPKSPTISGSGNLKVPRSPRTPGSGSGHQNLSLNRPMTFRINHRFTKTFKPARCDFCQEYFFQGLKCKECKFRCHTQCEASVPPSCGLPEQYLETFLKHLETNKSSPSLPRPPPPIVQTAPFDSSSSSCNSSTPSSPQVIVTSHPDTTPTTPWSALRHTPQGGLGQHFTFPTPSRPVASIQRVSVSSEKSVTPGTVDTIISNQSNDSDKTLSGSSDRSDSIGTAYRLDSQVNLKNQTNIYSIVCLNTYVLVDRSAYATFFLDSL